MKSWFLKESTDRARIDMDDYGQAFRRVSGPKEKDRGRRRFIDLVAWRMAFAAIRSGETNRRGFFFSTNQFDFETRAKAAPAVLEGLKSSAADLAELRAASRRPYSQYPVIYDLEDPWGIRIPHLERIKGIVPRLKLRACAELAASQSENALEDVNLMLYLADSLKEEPLLVSYLVRIECLQIAAQPVWEGLAEHGWSEAQLKELQTRFLRYDFLNDLKRPLGGERAAGILTADLLYRKKYHLSDLLDLPPSTFADLIGRIAPRGWYCQEQLNYCRLYENQLEGTFDAVKRRVSPGQIQIRASELEREIARGRLGKTLNAVVHHQLLAAMLLPTLTRLPYRAAVAQTTADQAALACALERYRLANGQFPETLEALVPRLLERMPNDVITGEPLKYRRGENGRFVLYSVGWNEKDEGGLPGKWLYDERQGDWVWRYLAE